MEVYLIHEQLWLFQECVKIYFSLSYFLVDSVLFLFLHANKIVQRIETEKEQGVMHTTLWSPSATEMQVLLFNSLNYRALWGSVVVL